VGGYEDISAISRKAAETQREGEAKKKSEKELLLSFFFSLRLGGFA
jgi:hypothetical protein